MAIRRIKMCLWFCFLTLTLTAASADELLPDSIAGAITTSTVQAGDTLGRIGARLGIDASVLARENALAVNAKLKPGQQLIIDNRHIIPKALSEGIIINVPQRMLFHFSGGAIDGHYPVGLGRRDWPTPTGHFKVVHLEEYKTWVVPKSIQEEMRKKGEVVLTEVPPGPTNPLGKHWIALSFGSLGVHSTIAPLSVYHFQSHGCIRLHADDAADLYERVMPEDPGEILYEPVLLARLPDGRVFLEVNPDIYGRTSDPKSVVTQLVAQHAIGASVDWMRVAEVLREKAGIARDVTATTSSP